MNGKVQGIIVCGVLAASLAGVMVFLNATGDKQNNDSSPSESSSSAKAESKAESVVILEKESDQIKAITVSNTYGGFTLDKPASGKTAWTVEELGTLNQNTGLKEGMITITGALEAYKLVEENTDDLAKYGLAEPTASALITYNDGTTATLDIGDTAPEDRYRYARVKSGTVHDGHENDVYMVLGSKLTYFLDPANAYADLNLIATPSSDDWPDYGTLTVTRSDWDYDVVFEDDPKDIQGMISSQVISSPIFAYLNITGSSDVTHGMWGLNASECSVIEPTDEDFEKYGLNDPCCVVKLKGDEYDYTLTVGDKAYAAQEDENANPVMLGYYCYLEGQSGQNAIYTISETSLPWVTFKIEDVISNIMLANYIVDIDTVSIEANGKTTVYEVEADGDSAQLMAEGGSANVTSVKSGGKDVDIYNFKSLYQYLMTCPTGELCFDEPQGDYEVKIVMTLNDGSGDTVELYKDTSRRYIAKLNGKPSFRIQSTWVDTLIKNIEALENGEAIQENY